MSNTKRYSIFCFEEDKVTLSYEWQRQIRHEMIRINLFPHEPCDSLILWENVRFHRSIDSITSWDIENFSPTLLLASNAWATTDKTQAIEFSSYPQNNWLQAMYLHVPYIVHPVESLAQIAQKHGWVIVRGKYESMAWAIDLRFHREF